METRAHHILIGGFAIAAFLLGLMFVLWLSKVSADREFGYYDVIFTEAVTGLSKGGLVQYNGIKVGEVSKLSLAPDDPRKVIARVRIDGGTPIKEDTVAKLGLAGVTGTAFIQLSGGSPQSKPLLPTVEHPVPVITAEDSAFAKLLSSGEDIITSANEAMLRVTQLLSAENVQNVGQTLENIHAITAAVADQRGDLSTALRQLAESTSELKATMTTLSEMAEATQQLMRDDARRVLVSADEAVQAIARVADSADGLLVGNRAAMNDFSENGLRQIGPLLVELRATLQSFKALSDQLGTSSGLLLGGDQPKEFKPK